MNTQLQYAFFSENFEIYQYKHRTYGHGVWFDPTTETYDAAYDRARIVALDKFEKDNPHLLSQPTMQPHIVENIGVINKDDSISPKLINHEIENAETLEDLKSYELLVNQPHNKSLLTMYNKRLEELSK